MSEAIKLLDHGFVRLVDSMGSDLSIVRNAQYDDTADATPSYLLPIVSASLRSGVEKTLN